MPFKLKLVFSFSWKENYRPCGNGVRGERNSIFSSLTKKIVETVVLNLSVHLNFYQENFSSVLFCSFLAAKSYQPRPQGAFSGFFSRPTSKARDWAPWGRGWKVIHFAAKQYGKVSWVVRHDRPANKRFSSRAAEDVSRENGQDRSETAVFTG